jgi:hypothetical protein
VRGRKRKKEKIKGFSLEVFCARKGEGEIGFDE